MKRNVHSTLEQDQRYRIFPPPIFRIRAARSDNFTTFFPKIYFSHEEHRALCAELVRNIDYLDEEQRMWLSEAIEAGFKPRAGRPKNPRYTTIMSWLLWNHFYGSQKLPRTEIISALMQSFEIEAVAAQQALNRAKREFDKTINSARRRLTPPGKGSSE